MKSTHKLRCGFKVRGKNKTLLECTSCSFTTLNAKKYTLHKSKEHKEQSKKGKKLKSSHSRRNHKTIDTQPSASKKVDNIVPSSKQLEADDQTYVNSSVLVAEETDLKVATSVCTEAKASSEYVEFDVELLKEKTEPQMSCIEEEQIETRQSSLIEAQEQALSRPSSEFISEYVEFDEKLLEEKIEPQMSCIEDEQIETRQSSFIEAQEQALSKASSEFLESEVTAEFVDRDVHNSLQNVTYATYVCSFDSCTFMTTVLNDKIRAEHYLSCHPSVALVDQQEFLKLT